MRVFRDIEQIRGQVKRGVVCVGSFDGLHRGHMELFRLMNKKAKEIGGESVVVTFDPHPRLVLKGENRLLMSLTEKLDLLEEAEVGNVLVIEFTKEFSKIEYGDFVRDYLVGGIGAQVVFSGDGHHFGKDKKGTSEMLKEFGLEVHNIERVDGISSTAVRDAIENGNFEVAEKMLGRPLTKMEMTKNITK